MFAELAVYTVAAVLPCTMERPVGANPARVPRDLCNPSDGMPDARMPVRALRCQPRAVVTGGEVGDRAYIEAVRGANLQRNRFVSANLGDKG